MFGAMRLWAGRAVLATTLCGFAARAAAQTPLFGGTLYREYDLAMRTAHGVDPAARAYFGLYRDVSSGAIPANLRLWFVSNDGRTFADAYARNATLDDQRFRLLLERTGTFRFRLERDETPHLISTDARMPAGSILTGDSLGLPASRPVTDTVALNALFNASPSIGAVSIATRNTRAMVQITPRADLAIRADWDHTTRAGQRPMGMVFAGPGGPTREILEPIDHDLDRVRISPSLNRQRVQAQVSYEYSRFQNGYASVMADNPTMVTNTASAGSSIGRSALAPNNHAHTFAASGGLNIPGGSRLTASASYSVRQQDQAFVARTINPAIDTSAFGAIEPSLRGDIRTMMFNAGWTARPHRLVTVTTRYTYFDLADRTPELEFKGRVSADRSASQAIFTREKHPFSRQTAVAELTWRARPNAMLRVSDTWSAWARDTESREVGHTTEHIPKVTLDVSPLDWLNVRSSYRAGRRFGDGYNAVAVSQNPELRKFDMADRAQRRFDLSADASPIRTASLGLTYSAARSHFDWSGYGLLRDDNDIMGLDVSWSPSRRVALTAGVMRQTYDLLMRSRYRAGVQLTNVTFDWITNQRDTVTSWDASANLVLVPRKLEATLSMSRVLGLTHLNNSNPYTPTGADPTTNANATVTPFAPMYYYLRPMSAVVRYTLSQTLTISARVSSEDFESSDFRTGGLSPATGGQFYLANYLQGYGARFFTFSIAYRPWVPGLHRPAL